MLFGYACVSTDDQNVDLQHGALKPPVAPKSSRIGSPGRRASAPAWAAALKAYAAGGALMVWRLDRLGPIARRSDRVANRPRRARRDRFRSLSESIGTTTPTGKLTFHVIGAGRVRARPHHRAHQRGLEGDQDARRAAGPQALDDSRAGEACAQAHRRRREPAHRHVHSRG